MTARQIIEARLGRPLGPVATMPRDLRTAMLRLGLALANKRARRPMSKTHGEGFADPIGSNDCTVCMGRKRLLTGMSFPPNKTIGVKYEYEPCPNCQPGPHGFFARRKMQILIELRAKNPLTATSTKT
jgi:hypothetical protein